MIENLENIIKLISQGVYVISVKHGHQENAFTAAWVMQVSFDPLLLCFSINPQHYSYDLLQQGKCCAVNVLSSDQMHIAEHFGQSSQTDKMAGYAWQKKVSGTPVLSDALGFFDCEVSHFAEAGDHKLVVCKVLDAGIFHSGTPMLYAETGNMDGSREIYRDKK